MLTQQQNDMILKYLMPYNPVSIGLFGSYARDEQTKESDMDIMITLKNTPSLLQLVKMERELSELLKTKVELITEKSIQHPKLKAYIYKDFKTIYTC